MQGLQDAEIRASGACRCHERDPQQESLKKAFAQATLAWAWCHTGESGKGIRVLIELIALYQATRYVPPQLPAVQFLGEGYWLAGEHDKERETAQGLLELAEQCGAHGYLGHAHRLLGEVALKTKPDQAAFHFDKAISLFGETKAENALAHSYAGYGRLHRKLGNPS
jgi:tetratricopeptide (TPR) repeat protein